jgi:TolB-like protein/class 3 adenylate cyclase/tetratricopeptide (TPR) repeat protein
MGHRLAAVLMADVVGYSRLMEADEAGTHAALKERRVSVLEPTVRANGGRVVKVMGDGVLIEFGSAVNAVTGAVDLQRRMTEANVPLPEARRIVLRIGINLGEVIGEGGDIYGEGVNIAARLETLAEPGGICLSAKVHEEVRGKLAYAFEDMGEHSVKNIARPIRAYRLRADNAIQGGPPARPILSLPDKPSIAVLPFQNMSGDPEQEYFADGMVEEIITALSRMRWLFVIARNSSFTYKGRAADVKQAGRDLGVRYVLEGSVRKAGSRVRVTGQLIDASTGAHLWADRFDGDLADIFDLQDQVTASVVGSIAPKLEQAEIERAKRKPTESLDAYDYFLRGMAAFHQFTRSANQEALSLFSRAIELDPDFASAHAMAARCYLQRKGFGWVRDRASEIAEADRLARRAANLGRDDAAALGAAGFSLVFVVGDLDDGPALIDRSLALNPNLALAWHASGLAKAFLGEPEAAIEHAARAMRLSPQDPQMFGMQTATALGYFFAEQHEVALAWAEAAVLEKSNFLLAACVATASAALAGKRAEAGKAMARLRQIDPALTLSNFKDLLPFRRPEDFARFAEGLRLAGLPE